MKKKMGGFDMKNLGGMVPWIVILVLLAFFMRGMRSVKPEVDIPYSVFKQYLREDRVKDVKVRQDLIRGTFTDKDGREQGFRAVPLNDPLPQKGYGRDILHRLVGYDDRDKSFGRVSEHYQRVPGDRNRVKQAGLTIADRLHDTTREVVAENIGYPAVIRGPQQVPAIGAPGEVGWTTVAEIEQYPVQGVTRLQCSHVHQNQCLTAIHIRQPA